MERECKSLANRVYQDSQNLYLSYINNSWKWKKFKFWHLSSLFISFFSSTKLELSEGISLREKKSPKKTNVRIPEWFLWRNIRERSRERRNQLEIIKVNYLVLELPGVNCISSQKDRQGICLVITSPSMVKYQTVHTVPKCISYQKAIGGLVMIMRAYFLWYLSTLCHETLLTSFIHKHGYVISAYMYT